MKAILSAVVAALISSTATTATPLMGVNLSGAEAAPKFTPGLLGTNYVYPSKADIELAYARGVRLFRLPLRAGRIQDGWHGPLRPEIDAKLRPVIAMIRQKPGANVLLDLHDFGKRDGFPYGMAPFDPDAIVDFWLKLAQPYAKASNVWIGLQNEPGTPPGYFKTQQIVVDELRSRGYSLPIVIDGLGYSAAVSWPKENGPAAAAFHGKNIIFDVHTYFDRTGAGVDPHCQAGAELRIEPALRHAEANGYKVLFGEMAFGDSPECIPVRRAVIARVKASPAVVGVTFWTLGNFVLYPRYLFGLTGPGMGQASPLFEAILAEWGR